MTDAHPMSHITFLNKNQALSGFVGDLALPPEYVLLVKAFGCGAIDRTETLDQGFDYRVIDPIPERFDDSRTFAQLCDETARKIVAEALEQSRNIRVFWSGGIDSTVAIIALMKAAAESDCANKINILVSTEAVEEYLEFFDIHIRGKYATTPITPPVSQYLDPEMLNVTGEMGDQLFGSYLSRNFVETGIAHIPYQDILPLVLTRTLKLPDLADRLIRYLQPQVEACPVRLESLFDYFWWINFSLKWQAVAMRLQVFRVQQIREVNDATRHFFRGPDFQNWSLSHPAARAAVADWRDYKMEAKKYIHEFTGDDVYLAEKTKEPSLKSVMHKAGDRKKRKVFVYMDEMFQAKFRYVKRGKRRNRHSA